MKLALLLGTTLSLVACATTPVASPLDEPVQTASAVGSASTDHRAIADIQSLAEVPGKLEALPPNAKVLVVFDIDDTLLTAETFFGSDLWYIWQTDKRTKPEDVVPCLFETVIPLNYLIGEQKPTEKVAGPEVFNGITQDKMILTSRAPASRSPTERELSKAGYSPLTNIGGNTGTGFMAPGKDGKLRMVTYVNGVFLTEGGDKGLALHLLLDDLKMKDRYDTVVLVDDTLSKQRDMRNEVEKLGKAFVGLHYLQIKNDDGRSEPLEPTEDQKEAAREFWSKLVTSMTNHYPRLGDGTACVNRP